MTGSATDLRPLLAPTSIAVVGASERPSPGRQVIENLIRLDYTGEILPINPKYDRVLDRRCFPSLSAAAKAGHRPEMVAILLGRSAIVPLLEEAGAMGVRAGWAFASGFAEADSAGRQHQDRLESVCREHDILFCGPNCVGYLNPQAGVGAYSAPISPRLHAGTVGAVAQSGSVCLALANSNRGIGFSLIVSSGNEAVVDATDYIAYLIDDPATEVILAFIEQIRSPKRFVEAAQRAHGVGKPIIVLKVGRSEMAQRATVAHTGALAGEDAAYDALFRKHHVLRVDDLDEMLETAGAFVGLGGDLPEGNRVGMITVSGGEIGLVGDLANDLDLTFPDWSQETVAAFRSVLPAYAGISNPLDAWGSGRIEETYPVCVHAAARDAVDIVVVSQNAPTGLASAQIAQFAGVARAAVKTRVETGKPIVAISHLAGGLDSELSDIFESGGVPLLQGTREGLRAVHHLIAYANARQAPPEVAERREAHRVSLPSKVGLLSEYESKRILAEVGIPCPRERVCNDLDEAVAAAAEIRYPVALKVSSPDIAHKTEARGIRLSIGDEPTLRRAYKEMLRDVARAAPEARLDGVLVQEMIEGAVAEIILGVTRDRELGPIVVFGLGGIAVELFRDRALGIPPLSEEEARSMIARTRAGRLLEGFRGAPAGDVDALVSVMLRVSELATDGEDRLAGMDINPLLVLPRGHGVVAADALIELRTAEPKNGG